MLRHLITSSGFVLLCAEWESWDSVFGVGYLVMGVDLFVEAVGVEGSLIQE